MSNVKGNPFLKELRVAIHSLGSDLFSLKSYLDLSDLCNSDSEKIEILSKLKGISKKLDQDFDAIQKKIHAQDESAGTLGSSLGA